MAIEFGCPDCRQRVRVADAAANKKGKCPHCNAISQIPGASEPVASKQPHARQAAQSATVSFPCPGCGRSMNARATLSGKRGKCPHCQTVFVIGQQAHASPPLQPPPTAGDLQPLESDDLAPLDGTGQFPGRSVDDLFAGLPPATPLLPAQPAATPLGYAPAAPRFGDAAGVPNPYASAAPVSSSFGGSATVAPLKLMIPATAMLLIAVITIGVFAFQIINVAFSKLPPDFAARRGLRGDPETAVMTYKIGAISAAVLGALINVGVAAGAVQMIRLRGWDTARGGAVAAVVPCCSVLCLNMPFGIWALIILNQPDVKRMFQ